MAIPTNPSGSKSSMNGPPSARGVAPRYLNMLLSIWLFISAFAWHHTPGLRTNTWIVAVFMFIVSLVSMGQPKARFWNTAAAVYLFISSFSFHSMDPGTVWNNVLVAIAVFVLSLVPSRTDTGNRFAHT
ncbi:MAG TPA: SPW repeat protein [Polyangiaceae bacterium]|nr:SPW repeat protein [Polyangiaceae bacterium]